MNKAVRLSIMAVIVLIMTMLPMLPADVFATENRKDVIWINGKSDDTVAINLNIYKSRGDSYGLEFTTANYSNKPKSFASGDYSSQGMIRLTYTDELIFRTNNGRWIGSNQEKDAGMTRTPFSRNQWHNLRVEFSSSKLTVSWYLDGVLLGTTPASSEKGITAISIFNESYINDGLQVVASMETTESEAAATATDTYKYVFRNAQGKNNWYFCEFGDYTEKELSYTDGQWRATDSGAYIGRGVWQPGNTSDVGAKYVAHKNGLLRLKGTVQAKDAECAKGNGVIAGIYRGNEIIWQGTVLYGNPASYNITVPVRQGEELSFRINDNGNYSYDWTSWDPVVEYINKDYSLEVDKYSYYQKNLSDSSKQSLTYNNETKAFEGSGACINGKLVSHTDGFVAGKSYTAPRDGRYRVYGGVAVGESDVTVAVYKNGENIYEKLFPKGEEGRLDVRAYLYAGDYIEAEILIDEPGGESPTEVDVKIDRITATMYSDETTSKGHSYEVIEELVLSDLIGTAQNENGMRYYFVSKDKMYDMVYNSSSQRWENTDSSGGYISKTSAYPGAYTDTVMEWTVPKDGTIRLDGNMFIHDRGDGTVCRIYKNDEVVWSNRVGGERLVRWDEPYDTSYFSDELNVAIPVKAGDKLVFFFDQWRIANNDPVFFDDVKISYIKGSLLSETTKWKIDKSVVLDFEKKEIYANKTGYKDSLRMVGEDIYISADSAKEIFGADTGESEFVLLSDVAAEENTVEVGNKLMILYGGLPTQFGFAELGEINSTINPSLDTDLPVTYSVTDENGGRVTESILKNTKYSVKLEAENYVGEDIDLKLILAKYNSDGILVDVELMADKEISVGTKYTSDESAVFEVDESISYVKIFVWNGFDGKNSLAESTKLDVK